MTLVVNSSSENQAEHTRDFLIGGGIMGELIRSKDWSATPLGPIESWPQSLRTTVSLCLASNFPIDLIWGPEHIQIYNDGYRPICAGKHPKSLGEDFTKTWASAWDIIGEAFRGALAGQTSFLENQRIVLDRNGYLEETFFTFSLSPIRDESGNIGGIFHPVIETTTQMLSQRRTRALQDLAARPSHAKTLQDACRLSAEALLDYQSDVPFALIYLVNEEGTQAQLVSSAHLEGGTPASPKVLSLCEVSAPAWPLSEVFRNGTALEVNGLEALFGPLACGPYPESPERALIHPIFMSGIGRPAAFLIMAVSPRLPFTEGYRGFLELAASTITAAMINACTYEEERARAEKLAELDRAKTVFFSNVSHEFRTPLTLMLAPLEEILSHPGEDLPAKRDMLELVHRNSLRLLRLVNTLLDFSRIEAGRIEAEYQATDLAALTRDLSSGFRSAVEKAGLSMQVDCPTLSEPIYIDQAMWEKIVLNLLSNAFKFTFEGSIAVSLRELDRAVELSVADTGTGVPANELPNLFKRFHRVHGSRSRTYEGTGIGLALVEDLVKLHGGAVRVESTLGVGTTFHVQVPKGCRHLPTGQVGNAASSAVVNKTGLMYLDEALRWLPAGNANAPAAPNRGAARILLADDNADMRQYIQKILAPEFEIQAVSDGAKALRAIREQPFDLVLTDVMMPELDGFGLLKELRSHKQTKAIPIVMLSARAGEEARVEGIEAGADDYLVKPFNARELLARVRVNLELANLRAALAREEQKILSLNEIEQQWRLFDTALSHSPDAISVFDLDMRFIYANRTVLDRWRKPLKEVIGKTLRDLGYSEDLASGLEHLLRRVIRDRTVVRNEAALVDYAGKTRAYDYIFVPILAADGQVEAIAGSSRDVTSFTETNRDLRAANADLEQFAYSASHDLRAPLRVIDNVSQWLAEDLQEHLTGEAREHIDLLRGRVKRMEKLLDDLLEYARIGRGSNGGQLEMVSGDVLVNDVVALLPRDGFAIRLDPALAGIRVRRMPLQQILMNLIGNAIKHHHRTIGNIEVSVEDCGPHYSFAVKDDGPGIPAQYHEQIFRMFQTLRPKDEVEGSGMGLALVRKYVELFGGVVTIESADTTGSTFRFTWPKHQD